MQCLSFLPLVKSFDLGKYFAHRDLIRNILIVIVGVKRGDDTLVIQSGVRNNKYEIVS